MEGGENPEFPRGSTPDPEGNSGWRDSPLEEPARPVGPMWNLEKIVKETCDIIDAGFERVELQKRFLTLAGFFTKLINGSRFEYMSFVGKMNSFLINYDELQVFWYREMFSQLPKYGDYTLVLENDPNKQVAVYGISSEIAESTLKELAEEVTELMFANGLQVKAMRALCQNINDKMDEKRTVMDEDYLHAEIFIKLTRVEVMALNVIVDEFAEIFTILDYINSSLSSGREPLTLSSFEETSDSERFTSLDRRPTLNDTRPSENEPPKEDTETSAGGKPIGPLWDKEKIMTETKHIIASSIHNLCIQKFFLGRLAFQIKDIAEQVSSIGLSTWKLNNFLINHNEIQIEWYMTFLRTLPCFGEYTLVFEGNSSDRVVVDDIDSPIPEVTLKELAHDITELLFASGMQLKAMRAICVSIDDKMDELREKTDPDFFHADSMIKTVNAEYLHVKMIMQELSEIITYLDFLNLTTGERSSVMESSGNESLP